MPIFDGALEAGADYLDMAMSLSQPHPERPTSCRARSSATSSSPRPGSGRRGPARAGGHRRRAGPVRRVRPLRRRPSVQPRSTRSGVRDGANLVVAGYDFAPTFSIWTTIEECLNPPVIWEKDRGWFTTAAVLRAGGLHLPRRDRAGRVRATSSTKRCCSIPRWVDCPRVDVQVRARRRVHRGAQDPAQARARPDRPGDGARPAGEPARRGGGVPARPADARRADDGQDLRRHVGHGHRHRRQPARGLPVSRGRQRRDLAARRQRRRSCGRPRSTRSSRWSSSRTGVVVGRRRARSRGVRRRPVPRPAERVRLPVGHGGADPA